MVMATPLSKVDSLYGPGTVIGWYLTVISCISSWLLHPRKRNKDSIDVDLVIILTLPVVAVFHLVSQISFLHRLPAAQSTSPETRLAMAAAIEAPLVIVEAFMTIAAVMIMIASLTLAVHRIVTVAVVGLLCFTVDWYVHRSTVNSTKLSNLFSRRYVEDSYIAILVIGVILGVLLLTSFGIASTALYLHRRTQQESGTALARLENSRLRHQSTAWEHDQSRPSPPDLQGDEAAARWSRILSLIFLPASMVSSFLGVTGLFGDLPSPESSSSPIGPNTATLRSAPDLATWFLPRSNCSLQDLDQVVALSAGATSLAFSMYSTVSHLAEHWSKAKQARREREEHENRRLRRLIQGGRNTADL